MNGANLRRLPRSARGFVIWQIILVLAILAILARVIAPKFETIQRKAEDKKMILQAYMVNKAIAEYRGDQPLRQAELAWAGKDADARYLLIKPYVDHAPDTLAQLCEDGYSMTLPDDIKGSVTITDPDSNPLQYQ